MARYLFIDGGALRAGMEKISEELTGDKKLLSPDLPELGSSFSKVFYYDAIPAQRHDEAKLNYEQRVQAEVDKFDEIQALPRFHVALGEVKGAGKKLRQKRVDVRLAVDMLTHTFRKNMDEAVLFASDDDFTPLVEALVREGMTVTVWHPERAANGLLNAADMRQEFRANNSTMYFLRDGKKAFQQLNQAKVSSPPAGKYKRGQNDEGFNFFIQWENDVLVVYRQERHNTLWRMISFRAVDATEEQALKAFNMVYGWGAPYIEHSYG